jgi:6-phosphogluconate dehydrogenase
MIGLGRMGTNMAQRLMNGGHEVDVFDPDWLLDLTAAALKDNPSMAGIAPHVSDSGEGRWTVQEAIDLDVPAPVITLSLLQRLRSRDETSYSDRLLAAMRKQFGGHAIKAG